MKMLQNVIQEVRSPSGVEVMSEVARACFENDRASLEYLALRLALCGAFPLCLLTPSSCSS
jgi:hypothetical protein